MQSEQIYLKLVFKFLTPVESAESNSIMSVFCRDFFYIELQETVLLTREKPAQLKQNLTFNCSLNKFKLANPVLNFFFLPVKMTRKVILCLDLILSFAKHLQTFRTTSSSSSLKTQLNWPSFQPIISGYLEPHHHPHIIKLYAELCVPSH